MNPFPNLFRNIRSSNYMLSIKSSHFMNIKIKSSTCKFLTINECLQEYSGSFNAPLRCFRIHHILHLKDC